MASGRFTTHVFGDGLELAVVQDADLRQPRARVMPPPPPPPRAARAPPPLDSPLLLFVLLELALVPQPHGLQPGLQGSAQRGVVEPLGQQLGARWRGAAQVGGRQHTGGHLQRHRTAQTIREAGQGVST